MADAIALLLAGAAAGQVALTLLLLGAQPGRTGAHLVLAAILIVLGALAGTPLAAAAFPDHRYGLYLGFVLAAIYLLMPLFWLYADTLTSQEQGVRLRAAWPHLAAALPGLGGAILVVLLPAGDRHSLFIEGTLSGNTQAEVTALALYSLVLLWCALSAGYLTAILWRLAAYRRRLRDLFSNNDQRELHWLSALMIGLGFVWLIAAAALLADNIVGPLPVDGRLPAGLLVGLISVLALFGLRQRPGFENRQGEGEPLVKYGKSALGAEQASRIAARLETAMAKDHLYLDPSLSLQKLSRHLGVPANLMSQTLNQTIGESFFDHVNRWRVRAAEPRIAAGQETVLEIALDVGFNSRSTFYGAFRKVTGQTPRDYRRAGNTGPIARQ
tara:strand:+ start:574 stop:1728 length:1155 start_codon:yes stop_codon:yes gene_type:complete